MTDNPKTDTPKFEMPKFELPRLEIPTDMRAFAEESVEQAKKAFDTFIEAAQKAVNTAETSAASARAGVKDVAQLSMRYAETNISSSFDFAQRLVRAKDAQEAIQLHADYVKAQIQVLGEQASEMATAATKAGMGATAPKADR
jgi:phasin